MLDDVQCRRLFDLSGELGQAVAMPAEIQSRLAQTIAGEQQELLTSTTSKNGQWFEAEMEKLDRWADDRRSTLKAELDELDQQIKDAKKAARLAPNLPEKLELQRKLRGIETKRDEAWRNYDTASREIDRQKDALLDDVSQRLQQKSEVTELFACRWRIN